MFLDTSTFQTVVSSTPLISIDLIVKNSRGEYLLGYRVNRPAQNHWFVPGGRVMKGEGLDNAFVRLCKDELGVNRARSEALFLGPFEHFYSDSIFGEKVSTHYVVLGYEVRVDSRFDLHTLPAEQHCSYRWFERTELLQNVDVHKHTKWYFS